MFQQDQSFDIICRILEAAPVKMRVLSEIQSFIKSEFMEEFKKGGDNFNPHAVVAEILNAFDQSAADKIMSKLEDNLPKDAARVRALMFTFEDLLRIDGPGIQKVIAAVNKNNLAIALKKASVAVKNLFLENMSERASKLLKDDMDTMGAVRMSDVEKAQRAVLSVTKELQRAGDIVISDADTSDALVS